jgi:hypothetical protein
MKTSPPCTTRRRKSREINQWKGSPAQSGTGIHTIAATLPDPTCPGPPRDSLVPPCPGSKRGRNLVTKAFSSFPFPGGIFFLSGDGGMGG